MTSVFIEKKCPICGYLSTNNPSRSLSKHLTTAHGKTKCAAQEILFLQYPELFPECIICKKRHNNRAPTGNLRKTCSQDCLDKKHREKQSQETIKKRLTNTDQKKKEQNRQKTMLEKYGKLTLNTGVKLKGKKRPRKPGQQDKIIESKRKNGTISHSPTTRYKIKKKLEEYYQKGDNQSVTVSQKVSNGKGHKSGYIDSILFRSSYEELFLVYCIEKGITVESAENKKHRIRYEFEGKKRWYYPDFFLPESDITIEIKPKSKLNNPIEMEKISTAQKMLGEHFLLLTEDELMNDLTLSTLLI